MIVQGRLRPGDRLPPEVELTARLQVSRSTLREALRVLSTQKLLTSARGVNGGTFVAGPAPQDVAGQLETSLTLLSRGAVSLADLIEMRDQLEIPAAGLAARRRTPGQLERLERLILDPPVDTSVLVDSVLRDDSVPAGSRARAGSVGPSGDSTGSTDLIGSADRIAPVGPDPVTTGRADEFHLTLLEAAGNPLVEMLTRPVLTVLREQFRRADPDPQFWSRAETEHAVIVDRIRARDSSGARRAMRSHLRSLRSCLAPGLLSAPPDLPHDALGLGSYGGPDLILPAPQTARSLSARRLRPGPGPRQGDPA